MSNRALAAVPKSGILSERMGLGGALLRPSAAAALIVVSF
jgi:hypothetical protein